MTKTNKEFYGDKLLAVVLKGNCDALYRMVHGKSCTGLSCGDCEFGITKENEIENVLQWLNAEHEEPEPPLLENGDSLQPGDWIMVRDGDGDKWCKMVFAFYYNNLFFVIDNAVLKEFNSFGSINEDGTGVTGWQQARLPMEGE